MTALSSACPRCGAAQDGTRSFCTSCGLALGAPATAPVPAPLTSPVCHDCGTLLPGAFCTTCGRPADGHDVTAEARALPVDAPALPPPPPPARDSPSHPPPTHAPAEAPLCEPEVAGAPPSRRRRRGPVLLVALVALVVLLGGGAGAWLLLGGENEAATAADPAPRAEAAEGVETFAATSPSPTPSVGPSETPVPTVTCWDGSEGNELADCGEPSGQAGLEWVFPSLDPARDACKVESGRVGKLRVNACTPALTGINRVNYSWWGDVETMLTYYDDEQGSASVRERRDATGVVLVYRYDSPQPDGTWKVAMLYADRPWSVTIYADSFEDRERVLRENLILIRNRAVYAGLPT